jgi:anti-sigma factor RsiW
MSPNDWQPDPQLLAAYLDGELNGRADVADIRARIETWLEAHPEAAEDWAELKKLLRDTAPAQPSEAAWQETRARIEARRPVAAPRNRRPWLVAAVVAASIVLVAGTLFGVWRSFQKPDDTLVKAPLPKAPQVDEFEVLQVASADEVTILRIDGADTEAVVVGLMPVSGEMVLAAPGEVCISCKCPRIQYRHDPPDTPMVWARAD